MSFTTFGQNYKIEGSINSIIGAKIVAASLKLQMGNKDSTLISFTTSNKVGEYKINFNKTADTLFLIAQHLGYEKQVFAFLPDSSINYKHDFNLREKVTMLNEVIVRQANPIKVSKDTTTYKVGNFIDGTEKNVEDVLKKLPGIKVAENGEVTFKGKKIDKITIEGDDFFSNNYKLISKNMPSFALDKVEAVENYNDNSLLKGITKSDKTILNLGIKEEIKSTSFGNIQAGAGITKRYDLQNTLFNISQKLKIGEITNLNNVGMDPISEVEYSLQTKNSFEVKDFEANPANFRVVENISNPSIGRSRYVGNNAKLMAVNLSKKLSPSTKARFWAYGFMDKTNQSVSSNSTYYLVDSTLEIYDNSRLQKKPALFKSSLEIEKIYKNNFQIKLQTSNDFSSPKSNLNNENEILGFKQFIKSKTQENSFGSTNILETTKKISEKQALIGYLSYQYNNIKNDYQVSSRQYSFLRNPSVQSDGIKQLLDFDEKMLVLKVKYVEHKNNRFTTFSVGINSLNNSIYSNLNLFDKNQDTLMLPKSFENDGTYRKQSVFGELNNVWELKKWSFFVNGSYHIGGIKSDFLVKKNEFNFLNKIAGFKFKPREGNTFTFVQSQVFVIPNLSDLANGYFLLNQRSFQRGSGLFNKNRNDITMINYSLIDMVNQLSFINNFNYIRTNSPYIANASINRNLTFVNIIPTDKDINNELLSMNSQVDKYIHVLRTRFKLGAEWSKNQSFYKIGDNELKRNLQNSLSLEGLFSTGFDFFLNVEVGFAKRDTKFRLSQNENFRNINNNSIHSTLRINSGTKLIGNVRIEYNKFNINSVKSNALFTDFWLSYKPVKGNLSYELVGKNIFNAKTISSLLFNNFYSTNNTFNLINRIIEFKLEYRFGAK